MKGQVPCVVSCSTGLPFSDKAIRQLPEFVEDMIGKKVSDEEWIRLCPPKAEFDALRLRVAKHGKLRGKQREETVRVKTINGMSEKVAKAKYATLRSKYNTDRFDVLKGMTFRQRWDWYRLENKGTVADYIPPQELVCGPDGPKELQLTTCFYHDNF